jgi:multidrug efflux pump subunit AcrB
VDGALKGTAALAEVPVQSSGKVFRLGDIATFHRGPQDPPTFVARYEGKPCIALGVVMAKGGNILELGHNLDAAMARLKADLPLGFEINRVADQPEVVADSVSEFVRSFVEALVIVLAVSFLSLGWRTGIVVALAVPLVLAMVMVVMNVLGISLERISLGALIIALGLLVDDAIISVEMMVVKMEQGFDRIKAATFAWTATAFPMLTGTLVTAAGFLPWALPNPFRANTRAAFSGWWPSHCCVHGSWPWSSRPIWDSSCCRFPHADHQNPQAIYETPLYVRLRRGITWCVEHRKTVIGTTIVLFVLSLVGFSFVSHQFFPLPPGRSFWSKCGCRLVPLSRQRPSPSRPWRPFVKKTPRSRCIPATSAPARRAGFYPCPRSCPMRVMASLS